MKVHSGLWLISALVGLVLLTGAYSIPGLATVGTGVQVDQHGTACVNPTLTWTQSISTTNPGELVLMVIQLNTVSPTSVTDSGGNVWHGPVPNFTGNGDTNLYWAVVAGAGTETVTMTMPDLEHFKVLWTAFTGADTAALSPFAGAASQSGPEAGPTLSVPVVANTDDFVFGYATQTGAAIAGNVPVPTAPWSIIDGTNDGCYSQATWMAGFTATAATNQVMDMVTFPASTNQVAGADISILPAPAIITTTTTTTTPAITTTTTPTVPPPNGTVTATVTVTSTYTTTYTTVSTVQGIITTTIVTSTVTNLSTTTTVLTSTVTSTAQSTAPGKYTNSQYLGGGILIFSVLGFAFTGRHKGEGP